MQVAQRPPTFAFFVNDVDIVHFSYRRFLENTLRARFGFDGTAIVFHFEVTPRTRVADLKGSGSEERELTVGSARRCGRVAPKNSGPDSPQSSRTTDTAARGHGSPLSSVIRAVIDASPGRTRPRRHWSSSGTLRRQLLQPGSCFQSDDPPKNPPLAFPRVQCCEGRLQVFGPHRDEVPFSRSPHGACVVVYDKSDAHSDQRDAEQRKRH